MNSTLPDPISYAVDTIALMLMPFFLLGAGGDADKAQAAAASLIRAYNPGSPQEIELAARVVGFSIVALDNLRLSVVTPDLSDTKIVRYRAAAVSLSRAAEECRATLKATQKERAEAPTPTEEPAPPVTVPKPTTQAAPPAATKPLMTSIQTEAAMKDARTMLSVFAKAGLSSLTGQQASVIRILPEPGAQISAAVTKAIAASQRLNPAAT